MGKSEGRVCVLAIGGLDPGGGAGILADARAIARAGAFACAAASLLTVQSTSGVRAVTPVPAKEVMAASTEVLRHQNVRAIKIGALGSEENVRKVGELLAIHKEIPSVIDTVMLPTRGRARLLDETGIAVMKQKLLRRATLVTVNAPEAAALTGLRVTRLGEAEEAARAIAQLGPKAVLLKGGHLSGDEAVDLLLIDGEVTKLRAKRLKLRDPVHGGGCALASLIAGRLARGESMLDAVEWAKRKHHDALADAIDVGGDMRVVVF
jgi:hydroxymethylpyrimidine/phosphomethylpyrimidine kinase